MPDRDTFSDLPDALVKDLLACAVPVADDVRSRVETLKVSRETFRQAAQKEKLISARRSWTSLENHLLLASMARIKSTG